MDRTELFAPTRWLIRTSDAPESLRQLPPWLVLPENRSTSAPSDSGRREIRTRSRAASRNAAPFAPGNNGPLFRAPEVPPPAPAPIYPRRKSGPELERPLLASGNRGGNFRREVPVPRNRPKILVPVYFAGKWRRKFPDAYFRAKNRAGNFRLDLFCPEKSPETPGSIFPSWKSRRKFPDGINCRKNAAGNFRPD